MEKQAAKQFGIQELAKTSELGIDPFFGIRELFFDHINYVFDISEKELIGSEKKPRITQGRAIFSWLFKRHFPEVSFAVLGRWLGGKKAHSVMLLLRRAVAWRRTDPVFCKACELSWVDKLEMRKLAQNRKAREFSYACA